LLKSWRQTVDFKMKRVLTYRPLRGKRGVELDNRQKSGLLASEGVTLR
jgi:hypothetical protein